MNKKRKNNRTQFSMKNKYLHTLKLAYCKKCCKEERKLQHFFYRKKRGEKFWAANVIQAMAFGLCHLNVVQGIYAFVLGLAIGYIKEAYGHIKACILFHFLFFR